MFKGKESSNRIQLSRLVKDLLNFGVLGCLWLWGGGRWVRGCLGASGDMGVSPHTCTHTHTHAHMYRNCKWLPTWRHPCLACLSCSTCMCMCVCACMCAWDTPPHPHTHPHLIHPSATSPGGWIPGISKNLITLELIKIFQFHLKI